MRESWGGKKERYRARHAEGVTEKWRERERERIGCGAEMPSCEREPSVKLGRMKEKEVIVASH